MIRRALSVVAAALAGLFAGRAVAGLDVVPAPIDLSGFAIRSQVPSASSATPPATSLDGSIGASPAYARADHTHAARVQRTVMMTAADGTAKWVFARPIIVTSGALPPVSYMVEDTGSPVVVQILSREFTTANGQDTHTSVTVRAQRSRALPATLVALTPLIGYDVFGIPAASVRVNMFAADPTQ